MLILDNDKLPAAKRWAESLVHSAIELEYQSLPGLIEMAMTAPQFATVPRAMIEATRHWLATVVTGAKADPAVTLSPAARIPEDDSWAARALTLAEDRESPQSTITECPVFISTGIPLFGII